MQTKVYSLDAKEVGKISLADSVFALPYNEALIHQIVVAYLANQRQGTKSTLTRAEVAGGGKKPWRQKGTGRARQGSIRSPQWVHGGVVFAPKPRDFTKKVNDKMKKGAFLSAISTMFAEKAVLVVKDFDLEPKTKEAVKVLDAFKLDRNVLVVSDEKDDNVIRAFSNLENVCVTYAGELCTYDLVWADKLLISQSAIKKIEEANK